MLKINRGQGRPSFFEGAKEHLQDDFDDPGFGGREKSTGGKLPDAAAKAAKKTVQ